MCCIAALAAEGILRVKSWMQPSRSADAHAHLVGSVDSTSCELTSHARKIRPWHPVELPLLDAIESTFAEICQAGSRWMAVSAATKTMM